MDGKLFWYTARASGILSWSLLAASVICGLSMTSRLFTTRLRRAWILDLHRFCAMAALVFLGVHVGSILLDTYVHFGLVDILVPFAGSWHPGAVAWGIAGFYLLCAIEVTSLLRSHLSRRLWRSTHFLTFPLFVVATVHGLTAGTDRRTVAFEVAFYGTGAVVAMLLAVRLATVRRRDGAVAPAVTDDALSTPRRGKSTARAAA